MTSLQEAQAALSWIKGEIPYIEGYLNDGRSDWPNVTTKTMMRCKEVNEKLKIIYDYAKEMEE